MCFTEEQVPKSELFGLDFQFLDDRNDGLPSAFGVVWQLSMGDTDCGENLILNMMFNMVVYVKSWGY